MRGIAQEMVLDRGEERKGQRLGVDESGTEK
jgi:hypothetical protein